MYMSRMSSSNSGGPKLVIYDDNYENNSKGYDSESSGSQSSKSHIKMRRASSIVVKLSQSDIEDL